MWDAYILITVCHLDELSPLSLYTVYLCLLLPFFTLSLIHLVQYHYTHLLWASIFWRIIFPPFAYSLYLPLELRWVSWRQHIVASCFLIHTAILCLLICEFDPFMFRVIIDRGKLSTAILSFLVAPYFLLLYPPVSLCHLVWWGFTMFSLFLSFLLKILCLFFRHILATMRVL